MQQPWLLLSVVFALAIGVIAWRWWRSAWRVAQFAKARKDFHMQRERLEVKFIQLASANARPNSPHWEDCDFGDDVAYVRSRSTGQLSAFVSVMVAIDGFASNSVDSGNAVRHMRAGTAVFRLDYDHGHWETDGRAILNLNPTEAIRFYRNDYEMVEQEAADRMA